MVLFNQLQEGAKGIALKDDFTPNGGMVDQIIAVIKELTGIDLTDLLGNVAPWIAEGVATVQNIVNQIIDIFNGLVVVPINAAIATLRNWFLGIFEPGLGGFSEQTGIKINNMQDQLQVLQGIIGYGSWVMSNNHYLNLVTGPADRVPQFDAQQGPKVGVELYTDPLLGNKKILRLQSRGLWEIKAQTKARRTGYTGGDKVYLDIVVRWPDGSEYYRRAADAIALKDNGGDGEITLKGDLFVVTRAPGFTVHVELFTERWRWFYGGSLWSGLSVLKHSSEVENEGTVDPGAPPVA